MSRGSTTCVSSSTCVTHKGVSSPPSERDKLSVWSSTARWMHMAAAAGWVYAFGAAHLDRVRRRGPKQP
eukprot:5221900-Prymnesium_polylepis.4